MGCNNNQLQLIGKRFGRLTVIKEHGRDERGAVLWLCMCDCGEEKTVISNHLTSGAVQSCGCLHSEEISIRNSQGALPKGQAAFNQLYQRYGKTARKRKLSF